MRQFWVNTLVKFWDSPLWLRKLFTGIGTVIVFKSSNKRCREYLESIAKVCHQNNVELTEHLKKDIIHSFIMFGASPTEFFLFNFIKKSDSERDEFLTDAYRTQLQKKVIGLDLFKNELIDKYNFYLLNQVFFHRACLKITEDTSYEIFREFVKNQGKVFLKINAGSFGYNAHSVSYGDEESLICKYKKLHLNEGTQWIAEGLVVQDSFMAVWNKTSVNTIRMPSFLTGGQSVIFRPFIRTGRAGAMVDNAGAGGIFAVIDETTGRIITDGADEAFNRYERHPDANIDFRGWQVPRWNELLRLTETAHRQMSQHKYIAYDFALTKDGWVMIEGNWGQYICQQTATQSGAKKKFKELINS